MINFQDSDSRAATRRMSFDCAALGIAVVLLFAAMPVAGREVALDGSVSGPERPQANLATAEDANASEHSWPPAARLASTVALVGAGVLLDRSADRWAVGHHRNAAVRVLRAVGDDAPIAMAALAGGDALFRPDSDDGRVARQAIKAGMAAATIVELTKISVDRSRPSFGRGASDFRHEKRADSSFPSFHTAVAWSVITPYAEYYDAPWLYGVAALTNFSRVAGRDHWFSDTVAGAAIGWWMGDLFHSRSQANGPSTASVFIVPHGLVVTAVFR